MRHVRSTLRSSLGADERFIAEGEWLLIGRASAGRAPNTGGANADRTAVAAHAHSRSLTLGVVGTRGASGLLGVTGAVGNVEGALLGEVACSGWPRTCIVRLVQITQQLPALWDHF